MAGPLRFYTIFASVQQVNPLKNKMAAVVAEQESQSGRGLLPPTTCRAAFITEFKDFSELNEFNKREQEIELERKKRPGPPQ